jgi:hypothetical protein
MKPIQHVKPIVRRSYESELVCKDCGAEDQFVAHYTEVTYGTALVTNRDGDLEDYDTHDSDDFQVNEYECTACGETSSHLDDLLVSESELEERRLAEEEEEDEEEELTQAEIDIRDEMGV